LKIGKGVGHRCNCPDILIHKALSYTRLVRILSLLILQQMLDRLFDNLNGKAAFITVRKLPAVWCEEQFERLHSTPLYDR
jgi:predicted lipid carrier protein YhbT